MFEVILAEIKDLKATQAQEITALHNCLAKIDEVLGQVPGWLKDAKVRFSKLEDKVEAMQQQVAQLRKSERLLEEVAGHRKLQ
ncbi:hypothetical protein NDU88_004543 [Pleurodeles waltl]|uniref:Uncharacterized protein n=1 Tax=Pleurodeles waltl TaxID=8319 RepID=A0AAV7NPM2_PLEWA|nr:hypothetical protein NDU88_004543 [Pleurodeles waltl]